MQCYVYSSLVNTVCTLVDFCDISINTASCACKFVLGVFQISIPNVYSIQSESISEKELVKCQSTPEEVQFGHLAEIATRPVCRLTKKWSGVYGKYGCIHESVTN